MMVSNISWEDICQKIINCGGQATIDDLPEQFQAFIKSKHSEPYLKILKAYLILPIWIDGEGFFRIEPDWQERLSVGKGKREDLIKYLQSELRNIRSAQACYKQLTLAKCLDVRCHFHITGNTDSSQCYKELLENALVMIQP